jgi:hypothetical protein
VNVCRFCSGAITSSYYRVGPVMACPACVERERTKELANKGKFFRRGLLFAIPAALVGSFMIWGVDEFSSLGGSSLYSPAAFLRGGATVFLGFLIGAAAMRGAKKRGSRMLQICTSVLTYIAYSMGIGLYLLNRMPAGTIRPSSVVALFPIALAFPFLALMKSWTAITGLIVLFATISGVWKSTAPIVPVSGPFDATDKYAEKPLFRGLGA